MMDSDNHALAGHTHHFRIGGRMEATAFRQSLNLAPLYRHCVFQSARKVESHDLVARELSDHSLLWQGDNVETSLFKSAIRQLQLFSLKYGAEIIVRPRPFDGFLLMHMTISGTAEIDCDGKRLVIPKGKTALISPKKYLRMWWQAGSEQLILKVPFSLFLTGDTPVVLAADQIPSLFSLQEAHYPHWHMLMQSLLQILDLPAQEEHHAAWIDHFERSTAQFLLSRFTTAPPPPDNLSRQDSAAITSGIGLSCASGMERLDALEAYIQSRLCAPISLVDLSNAAGVSIRALNLLCHKHHGVPPMLLLRNMRLDAARHHLLAHPGDTITDVAFRFGFSHLGRFSGYYRERFGELPRQTYKPA